MAKGDRIRKQALMFKPNEPKFTNIDYESENYNVMLSNGLNYINQNLSIEDCAKYAKEFYTDLNLSLVPDFEFSTIGALSYLIFRGANLSHKHKDIMNKKVKELFTKYPQKQTTNKIKGKAENLAQHSDDFLEALHGAIDDKFVQKKQVNLDELFKNKTKKLGTVVSLLQNYKKEMELALENPEGYENYSKLELKSYLNFFNTLLNRLKTDKSIKKTRKPRKLKKVDPLKVTKQVKLLDNDKFLGIKGLTPDKIVGANSVFLFNTEKRVLFMYHAESGKTLSVKGKTIIGYDKNKTYGKTIRKPKEYFSTFMQETKIGSRRLIENVKGVECIAKGRLHDKILLLKAY